jgi:hypothetical protein
MNSTDAAYAAGIIDGEGYVAFLSAGAGRGRRRPQIEVSSTDPELIDWLAEKCGGFKTKPVERGGNRKTEYRWRINGLQARDFAREIAPFMVINRKREKAFELAKWQPLRGPGARK